MSNSSSVADLQLINRICDEFEDQILSGETPVIEAALTNVDVSLQSSLLAELLRVELYYFHQSGQHPTVESYVKRFPNDYDQIVSAFASSEDEQFVKTVREGAEVRRTGSKKAGDSIGRFQIESVLGSGAFADVYLAYDDKSRRPVAIKAMRPVRAELDLQMVESFVAEANTLSRLSHSAIADVYEISRDENGLPFVVMEYVKGHALLHFVKHDLMTVEAVIALLADIAETLAYVHQENIYHRDLKPANIIVGLDGKPRIVDFGLALHESVQRDRPGEVAGSLSYMSPEQIRGEAHHMDGRSDIWALGIMLYEALTGRRPFGGNSREQLVDEIFHRLPRPLRQTNTNITKGMEAVCIKALEKKPEDRYLTAQDFADDLRKELDGFSVAMAFADSDQMQTASGRAQVRLAGQARIWKEKPEKRRLPTFWQFVRIRLFTRTRSWTESESRMMRSAVAYYGKRIAAVSMLLLVSLFVYHHYTSLLIDDRILELREVEFERLAAVTGKLRPFEHRAIPAIIKALEHPEVAESHAKTQNHLVAIYNEDHLLRGLQKADRTVINRIQRILDGVLEQTETVNAIQDADGVMRKQFVFCSTLPFEKLDGLNDELGKWNYRLALARPYSFDEAKLVAAIWLRDGNQSLFKSGMSVDELAKANEKLNQKNFDIEMEVRPDYFTTREGIRGLSDIRVHVTDAPINNQIKYDQQYGFAKKHREDINAEFMLARAEFYRGNYQLALDQFNDLVDMDPETWKVMAWPFVAQAHARLGDHESARRKLDAIRTDIAFAHAVALETKLLVYQGNHQEAFQKLELRISRNPNESELLFFAATAYSSAARFLQEDRENAIMLRQRALELLRRANDNHLEKPNRFWTSPDLDEVRNHFDLCQLAGSPRFVTYSGTWNPDQNIETEFSDGRIPDQHLRTCVEFIKDGFYPVSIDAIQSDPGKPPTVASVWHKRAAASERVARNQKTTRIQLEQNRIERIAVAAAAKLKHSLVFNDDPGNQYNDWVELLRHDPSLATQLVHTFWKFDIDIETVLLAELNRQRDPDIRRSLLLAIGANPPRNFDGVRKKIENALLAIESDNKDPAVKGAIYWLRGKLGVQVEVEYGEDPKFAPVENWYSNRLGQTMIRIKGARQNEFWISNTEVTLDQLRRIDPGFPNHEDNEWPDNTVAFGISWYQAARICNLLGKAAGIDEDQWCYKPNENGDYAAGMTIKPNYKELSGYRLPMQFEWEMACRAGTSSSWFHGESTELLTKYAWHYRTMSPRPVALLMPNGFGLFDMSGNVFEWTMKPSPKPIGDATEFGIRGGSSWVDKNNLRSVAIQFEPASSKTKDIGFRVVRSIPVNKN